MLTNWPTYNYLVRGGPVPLRYYYLLGLVALAVLAVRPGGAATLVREKLMWWFAFFVISGLAWLLLSQDFPDIAVRQWRLRVLAAYFFCATFLAALVARRSVLALFILFSVVVVGALNWYDVLFPLTLVPRNVDGANPGRGAGMFINANAAAALILMGTIAVLAHVGMRWRAAVLLVAAFGIAPTFSRFGFIGIVLLMGAAAVCRLLDGGQRLILLLAVPALVACGVVYQQSVRQDPNADRNIAERLAWFESFGRETDFSTRERAHVARRAWESIVESPVLGHGVGTTLAQGRRVGTHNMYLLLMAEQGVFGLALYLSLIVLLARGGWRLARSAPDESGRDLGVTMAIYAMFLVLYGFVSHNVLEEPHGMFVLAFIAASARCAGPGGTVKSRSVHLATLGRPLRLN
ncbi:MAG: O-antigen ligase family protein [Burkholderiales bacterium]